MYAHKIVVLENAVNIPPKEEVCAKRPEEPVTVLSVGSLTRQKRHDILIRVLVQVREQVTKPVRLVIVGEGAERDRLEQLITELGVSDIVTLTGALQHNEVIAWYRASHIFALASEWEGDPNVVKEAMAQCLPIVATSCTGIKEIIKHGFSGSLCDINDEAGLSRAIGDLLSDKKLRDELGAQAFSFAYERFGIDNHITQLKNVWSAR